MESLETIFSIVGAVALLIGGGFAVWRAQMRLGWQRRRATVVSYARSQARRGSSRAKLKVRFKTDDGEEVEATDEGPWNRYHVDQAVTVLLVPDSDAHRVVVPEFLRFWMMSLIFIPFAGAFLYVALVYLPTLE